MKVLLIDPAGAQRYVTHNAGLAYLSSALLARDHEVRVLDMNNYDFTNDEVAAYARQFKPDWVGASVKTALVSPPKRTMRAIRAAWPHARTMVGGAHIGVTGAGYMSTQDVYEFGLTGEGERAVPDLIEGKDIQRYSRIGLLRQRRLAGQQNRVHLRSRRSCPIQPTEPGSASTVRRFLT